VNAYAAPLLASLFINSLPVTCFNQPFWDVAVIFNQLGEFVPASSLRLPLFTKPEIFPRSIRDLSIVRLNTGPTFAVTLIPVTEPEALAPSLLISTGVTTAFQLVSVTTPSPIFSANAFQAFKIKIPTIETKAIAFCIFVFI
jgi:hypothetical protein